MKLELIFLSKINPIQLIKHFLDPFTHSTNVLLNDKSIQVKWTNRAKTELIKRDSPLVIELQLYFACMVTKRILFHDSTDLVHTPVTNKLAICFRTVQSNSCELASSTTKVSDKKALTSVAAKKMHPSKLQLDYSNKCWVAEYFI